MAYKDVTPPPGGKITIAAGRLSVPDHPVIPFIRGDGTGPDIWASSVRVLDAAVAEGLRREAQDRMVRGVRGRGELQALQQLAARRHGGGLQRVHWSGSRARSRPLSAAASARSTWRFARCSTSTSACGRFSGSRACPRPSSSPEQVNMVIFRENTEDIYAGIEFAAGTPESQKILDFIAKEFPKSLREDPLRDKGKGRGILEARSGPRGFRPTSRWGSGSSRSAIREASG